MSLLTVCNALALNTGMAAPDVIVTSPERQWIEALQMANEAGEELARRVDWGILLRSASFAGDGVTQSFEMPAGFGRLAMGVAVRAGSTILRALSQGEWNRLDAVAGAPRYFKLDGGTIRFWPIPPVSTTVTVAYLTEYGVNSTTGYQADSETALLDETLLAKALIVRWRRQKGMPYADEEAEYEATLVDRARFDDRSRL